MTAQELINIREAFLELSQKEFDLNTACDIAENISKLSVKTDVIQKKVGDIINKYAIKDENGNPIVTKGMVKLTDVFEYQKEHNALMEQEVDAPEIKPISKKELSQCKLKPNVIMALGCYLVD